MGVPRIAARYLLDSDAAAERAIGAFRSALNGQRVRKEHGLHRFRDDADRHAAVLDVSLERGAGLEGLKNSLFAGAAHAGVLEAVIEWHDCGEDEPEPAHLDSWHPEYQLWRVTRDCSKRSYGREVIRPGKGVKRG